MTQLLLSLTGLDELKKAAYLLAVAFLSTTQIILQLLSHLWIWSL